MAAGEQEGQIDALRLAGQYLGGGGVPRGVCAVITSSRGCWQLQEMGQADLGLSQHAVTQT